MTQREKVTTGKITRRCAMAGLAAVTAAGVSSLSLSRAETPPAVAAEPWAAQLIKAAASQIGRTTIYDPAYAALAYPMGDIAIERGVCTDVVIRAYRAAFAIDLQQLVHEDMARHFTSYPKIWGLKRPDKNIDHRRVPNLEAFLTRSGAALPVSDRAQDYRPGDIVTQRLPGNLPHIAIVSDTLSGPDGAPLVVHNIGRGTQLENSLFSYTLHSHFRFAAGRAA